MANPYLNYYEHQVQHGGSYFAGTRYQRGHGLGSILASLFRSTLLPALKSGGKYLGTQALKTGIDVGTDMITSNFKGIKESVKKRGKEAGNRIANDVQRKVQTGGRRRKAKQIGMGKKRKARKGRKSQTGGGKKLYKMKRKTQSSSKALLAALNKQLK